MVLARHLVCALLVWSVIAQTARAQEVLPAASCRVELVNAPSLTWREAEAWLPFASNPGAGCRELYIHVDERGADVTFVALDGQRTQQRLARPEELAPWLQALDRPAPQPAAPVAAASGSPSPPPWALLGSLLAGARVGERALLSPVLSGTLLLRLHSWELGVGLGWEVKYHELTTGLTRGTNAITPGLSFARREPLGPTALLYGLRAGVGVVRRNEYRIVSDGADTGLSLSRTTGRATDAELRPGTFVGVALPRRGAVRFRVELAFDFVAWSSFQQRYVFAADQGTGFVGTVDDMPSWAFSLMLGAELGRP